MSKVYNVIIYENDRPIENHKCLARNESEARDMVYRDYIENNLCDPKNISTDVAILGFKLKD